MASREVSISKEFKEFEAFEVFKEFKEFKELEAFKEFKELSFLSYYQDFKLLLCSTCFLAINPLNFKGHLTKHFTNYKGKEKDNKIKEVLNILKDLEVSNLIESHNLILLFSKQFNLFPFKELKILRNIYQCAISNTCSISNLSEYRIKRHIREEHKDLLSNLNDINFLNKYIVIPKGQSLEKTRFFFAVKDKGKGKEIEEEEEESQEESLIEEELIEEESESEDDFKLASSLFLKEFESKKKEIKEKLSNFKLDLNDKLTLFQTKTRYIEFITKYKREDLINLSSLLSKEEELLEVLIVNLKELLYLSLEKSIFLNKVHLNHLNSF